MVVSICHCLSKILDAYGGFFLDNATQFTVLIDMDGFSVRQYLTKQGNVLTTINT